MLTFGTYNLWNLDLPHTAAHNAVVVGDQDAGHQLCRHGSSSTGTASSTVVPSPGADSMLSDAPTSRARSRIPRMPNDDSS